MTGFVYFLRCGDFVKVGYSTDVARRMASLQTGQADKLHLLGKLPGSPYQEHLTQQALGHLHHRGEWFRMHEDFARLINDGLPTQYNHSIPPFTKSRKVDVARLKRELFHRDLAVFKTEVLSFLRETGMADSLFGTLARNDKCLVERLRRGHRYRNSVRAAVRAFMASYRKAEIAA